MDQEVALVVKDGKIALLSVLLAPRPSQGISLRTMDGLVAPGATDEQVVQYLTKNGIHFDTADKEIHPSGKRRGTQVSFRNYIIPGAHVILKLINGRLFSLLLCSPSVFDSLARAPDRLDAPLGPGWFWVEPSFMRLLLLTWPPAESSVFSHPLPDACRLLVTISMDGSVLYAGVQARRRTPAGCQLTHQALGEISRWRFHPYKVDGEAVTVETAMQLEGSK